MERETILLIVEQGRETLLRRAQDEKTWTLYSENPHRIQHFTAWFGPAGLEHSESGGPTWKIPLAGLLIAKRRKLSAEERARLTVQLRESAFQPRVQSEEGPTQKIAHPLREANPGEPWDLFSEIPHEMRRYARLFGPGEKDYQIPTGLKWAIPVADLAIRRAPRRVNL
jgi:hypothetical protein